MIYWLIGIPVFALIYVYFARKVEDIDVKSFLAMVVVASIPFLREFVLLSCIFDALVKNKDKFEKFFNSVVFKKSKG